MVAYMKVHDLRDAPWVPKMESYKPLVSLRERFEVESPSKAMPRKPSTSLEIDARRRI